MNYLMISTKSKLYKHISNDEYMMPFYPLYNSIHFKVSKHKIRQKEFIKATVILAVEALKMDKTPT